MIKYRLVLSNQTIEFASEEAALDYKAQNNLTEEIESFEYNVPVIVNVPSSVTPRQMRVALVVSGISLESIEAMINGLEEPTKSITRITWEYSTAFERDNPILNAMAPLLGLDQSGVDQLFILAETL